MSSREFWAAEAAKMRDTSTLFDMSHLAPSSRNKKNSPGAWEIGSRWDDQKIAEFRAFLGGAINAIETKKETYACEDFAVTLVMTFAKENKLPFKWVTGSQKFDADIWGGMASFTSSVRARTGAKDVQNNTNTTKISLQSAQKGDMILLNGKEKYAHHVQIIYNVGENKIDIKQGNEGSFFVKYPTTIQTAVYNLGDDSYENKSTGHKVKNYSQEEDIEFRIFNFKQWND